MSTYEMGIDGSSAEAGAKKIVKSFDDIKAAADRMEGGVSAAARKASASFSSFANMKGPSPQVVQAIKELSSTMAGFKGPSQASVNNTLALLNGLKAVGALRVSGAGVAGLLSSMSSYKGPSGASAGNTNKLLAALAKFGGIGGSTRGSAAILTAMNGYRGPSMASVKNTQALLNALQNFKAPSGLAAVARAFEAMSASASRASASISKLRSLAAGNTEIKLNTKNAAAGLSALTKEHGLLQGAVFKTRTLYQSLGGFLAAKEIIGASNAIIKIKAQLEAATGSIQQERVQFGFLREYAGKLGLEFRSLAQSYGFFLGSIKGTGVAVADAKQIFVGFSTAARALQLSTDDVDGVFRALGQMLSKGKLQAEELRGQLGDRLPGAFVRFAKALNMTKPGELDQALKKGTISATQLKDAILKVSQTLEVEFAHSADVMSKTVDAAFNRLKNSFTFDAAELGANGMNRALIALADSTRKFLESDKLNKFLSGLGATLEYLGNHIEGVASIISGVLVAAFASWILNLTKVVPIVVSATSVVWEFGTAILALGSGATLASLAGLGTALEAIGVAIAANPIGILAVAIGAVTAAYLYFSDATDQSHKALLESNKTMGDADNFLQAYTANVFDSTGKLNENTQAILNNAAAMEKSAFFSRQVIGHVGRMSGGLGPQEFKIGDNDVSSKVLQDLIKKSPLQINKQTGAVDVPTMYNAAQAQAYGRRMGDYANNYALIRNALPSSDQKAGDFALEMLKGRMNQGAHAQGLQKDVFGYDLHGALGVAAKDADFNKENNQGTGLTGSPVTKAGKTKKAPTDTNIADLNRIQNSVRDLNREVTDANEAFKTLMNGGDIQETQAQSAAVAKVNSFADAFNSPEKKIRGIMDLAKDLRGQGAIGPNVDISSYDAATTAITDYVAAQELQALQAKRDANVAGDISDLARENNLRKDNAEAIAKGGVAMETANTTMEVEQKLIGTSLANRDALRDKLTKEIETRNELNKITEIGNATRDYNAQASVSGSMGELYGKGFSSEELDYYKELYTTRQQLINDGYTDDKLRSMMAIKQATLDLADADRIAQQEEEKLRQLAADQADAVVGAFEKGMQAGDSFLKTMKNIFKDLKNVLLDFVLYNPLKDFLKQSFQSMDAPAYGNRGVRGIFSTLNSQADSGVGDSTSLSNLVSVLTKATDPVAPVANSSIMNSSTAKATAYGVKEGNSDVSQGIQVIGRSLSQLLPDISSPINVTHKKSSDPFANLKSVYDYHSNQQAFKDLKSGTTDAVEGAVSAGMKAFAAFGMGKQVGKMLGLGRTGSNVLGGASAGYSVGGPIGAAIGAGVALWGSILLKKKIPSAYSNVTVGANGAAMGGAAGVYGKGDKKVATAAGQAGAGLFNQFAINYDGTLAAGNYGTFGSRKFKENGKKVDESFYSLTGNLKKGKPVGQEGVDWIKGTESEVQAFALIAQLKKGMIGGLSPTLKTVGMNTKATTIEQLQSDMEVGKAYDTFVKASYQINDTAKQVRDLNDSFESLSKQAAALSLSEDKLAKARDRLLKSMKENFNYGVSQDILGITDPTQAAYNDLVKEYKDRVESGMAVGGDLVQVEKLYGLKRVELAKQLAEEQTNVYKDLLTSLTSSSSSPLNADTVLQNAQGQFEGLKGAIKSGDTSGIDNLQTYVENYLGAARNVNASGSGYFDIFNEVTSFLQSMSDSTSTTNGTSNADLPSLPSLDSIIAEITAKNDEMIDVQTNIGTAIVETGADTTAAITKSNDYLAQIAELMVQNNGGSLYGIGNINNYKYAGYIY